MLKKLFAYCQYMIPQHLLTRLLGKLASVKTPSIKNRLINGFIHLYQIDMSEALEEDPTQYATFNDFFIRKLKPNARPLATDPVSILSPADGAIAQIGLIAKDRLIQAKDRYFTLNSLLAGNHGLTEIFQDGAFTTIYLAPNNYHRYHMPIAGKLTQSIYVPGQLFSVNQTTAEYIPDLYSRNERLITVFETEIGKVAIIMVGAMIVGSIQTVWMDQPIKGNSIKTDKMGDGLELTKGAELGCFKLGSTVILLFEKNKIEWLAQHTAGSPINFGQELARKVILAKN